MVRSTDAMQPEEGRKSKTSEANRMVRSTDAMQPEEGRKSKTSEANRIVRSNSMSALPVVNNDLTSGYAPDILNLIIGMDVTAPRHDLHQ